MTLANMLAIHVPVKARTMRSVVVIIVAGDHRIDDSAASFHRGADNRAGYADSRANDSACRTHGGADQT